MNNKDSCGLYLDIISYHISYVISVILLKSKPVLKVKKKEMLNLLQDSTVLDISECVVICWTPHYRMVIL